MSQPPRIACFLSTSGHSGVDRLARHLLPALVGRGYRVDLLKVREHGPHLEHCDPAPRIVDLGTAHTLLALPAVVRYLRHERPVVMLSDKDRVNRLLEHYEQQSDEEAVAEDEAALEDGTLTLMRVPTDLVPQIRALIAKHHKKVG